MPKPTRRAYARVTLQALRLLGQQISLGRKERKITAQELADRAGISRGLVRRIESGYPGSQIGAVFEVATIVGVQLFGADERTLATHVRDAAARLTLLPRHTHRSRKPVDDEF